MKKSRETHRSQVGVPTLQHHQAPPSGSPSSALFSLDQAELGGLVMTIRLNNGEESVLQRKEGNFGLTSRVSASCAVAQPCSTVSLSLGLRLSLAYPALELI